MNAVEIEEAVSALAAEPFDPAEFPFAFLTAFGMKATTLARLRQGASNNSDAGGILQRNNIHILTTPPGETLAGLAHMRESPQTARQKAKFILATDGQQVEAEEIASGEVLSVPFAELGDHFSFFLSLAGISTVAEVKNNPIDIKATGRLNRLYLQLLKDNPAWGTAAKRGDLNRFMARLIFCFFAEDTGIFTGETLFTATLTQMTQADGSNTAEVLAELFRAMTLDPRRSPRGVRPWADVFPYVNGGLFADDIGCPAFTRTSRAYLLRAGELDWKRINPDIFGSMIQAVADDDERGQLGMHYTSVPNIRKVLDPLFLDDLRAQLERAGTNKRMLFSLRQRLARIRVFDPACGSGNFLVIAYIQMREIEAEIMARRGEAMERSAIALTQFYGIEIKSFAAEIARLSLLIAEFQCDVRFIGQAEARALVLPLHATGNIVTGNALRIAWEAVCPPAAAAVDEDLGGPTGRLALEGGPEWETYICGNPPYQGSVGQTREQKDDMALVFRGLLKAYKDLDYVAAWFVRAAFFLKHTSGHAAFVATNSITQGEQVAMLWPILFSEGVRIGFAHSSFVWANNAANNAGVTCVIVGITNKAGDPALHEEGVARVVANITPYLTGGDNVVVTKQTSSLANLPLMQSGNQPSDDGQFVLNAEEAKSLARSCPKAAKWIRKFMGAREFIRAEERYCIWINDDDRSEALAVPEICRRVGEVRAFRLGSRGKQANDHAPFPHRFVYRPHRETPAIIIPKVSSERRQYLPCGYVTSDTVVSNLASVIYDAPLWNLALIASRIHLVWIATVCGKLKTDFRYSNTLGWNTFPVPKLTAADKAALTACAEDILLTREAHFPATIADLYDPENMPADLRAAHDRNDEVLERIYIGRRFRNDTERLEHLFALYTRMTKAEGKRA
ncbi:class I SAM-dependent DNA methyltransferase [Paracoccus luteus]|uniref:class I SAM-dependent DNA methyltransferase n=1 Tax=Paracoccus luteus TaxID=2508543 RepID=UPI00106F8F01|nr:DNA methyltransferase [Paracoccus luteus]